MRDNQVVGRRRAGGMLKNVAVVAVVLWLCTLLYIYLQLFVSPSPGVSEEMMNSWREAMDTLNTLRKQNEQLRQLVQDERRERNLQHQQILTSHQEVTKPTEKKEATKIAVIKPVFNRNLSSARRLLDDRIREMFYYLHAQKSTISDEITAAHVEEQMISLMGASERLDDADQFADTRSETLAKIASDIQKSIENLQNPSVCKNARALLCNLDKECGFGCQLHHVSYCFIMAFATSRTLVLRRDGTTWRYSTNGWSAVFMPLSNCTYEEIIANEQSATFTEQSESRIVTLGIVDGLSNKPLFLPLAFPSTLSKELTSLHSNPPVFFVGQFLAYLMRTNEPTEEKLRSVYRAIPFDKGPIVGLQVRRTDKIGTEAAFHKVEEYMKWTEFWFRVQERRLSANLTRRIFVATDDPTVVPEAKKLYPQYEVYGSTDIAKTAQLSHRYTDASLIGVISDIFVLSKMDYLVCTFSSQVCRMGYELRQAAGKDDGTKFHSLDDIYYFGGQHPHEQVAVEAHKPERRGEIELKVGDRIGIAGNHWDGFSKGQNRRTGADGLYPSYKVVEFWRTLDYKALSGCEDVAPEMTSSLLLVLLFVHLGFCQQPETLHDGEADFRWNRWEERTLDCVTSGKKDECVLLAPNSQNPPNPTTFKCRREPMPHESYNTLAANSTTRLACPIHCPVEFDLSVLQKRPYVNKNCQKYYTYGKYRDVKENQWYIWMTEPCVAAITTHCRFNDVKSAAAKLQAPPQTKPTENRKAAARS
ncbi:unnamed protein product [Caenorhabditis auriculariae]|uniref:Alpha-(1,6)-fucosyltransferase n=1 Tax=Caenorhabditis auriculariae TaxID=2777116 RepID=A0A8S1GSP5_9PELO|nr:unnamed protein product [Caenorhabditis auriculariae]